MISADSLLRENASELVMYELVLRMHIYTGYVHFNGVRVKSALKVPWLLRADEHNALIMCVTNSPKQGIRRES
jgi:hypothetical protein